MDEFLYLKTIYREMQNAIRDGKIVAIELNDIREFVNNVRRSCEGRYSVGTLAGRFELTDKTAVRYFDNAHDAQAFIFRKEAA